MLQDFANKKRDVVLVLMESIVNTYCPNKYSIKIFICGTKEKKCKNAKWLSEEALQRAVKREAKSKGEKEKYTHLNAEFQRIARRDKKAFLSDQCKETEENNRMGKTRDLSLQENQRYEGNISCKDGLDKGQKWYGHNRSRRY